MNKELSKAGVVAIPVKSNIALNPSADWFIIDSQQGNVLVDFKNILTGAIEKTNCCEITYRIAYREILPDVDGKQQEFCERNLLNTESLLIPIDMLPALCNHIRIKENLPLVNVALSHFSFRGVLANLILEVDELRLDEMIADSNVQ